MPVPTTIAPKAAPPCRSLPAKCCRRIQDRIQREGRVLNATVPPDGTSCCGIVHLPMRCRSASRCGAHRWRRLLMRFNPRSKYLHSAGCGDWHVADRRAASLLSGLHDRVPVGHWEQAKPQPRTRGRWMSGQGSGISPTGTSIRAGSSRAARRRARPRARPGSSTRAPGDAVALGDADEIRVVQVDRDQPVAVSSLCMRRTLP